MPITQTFSSNRFLKEEELYRSFIYIKRVYESLGYFIDKIKFVVRAGIPILYQNSSEKSCQIVEFFPFLLQGRRAKRLSKRERTMLNLDAWRDWFCLGSKYSERGALVPLIFLQSNLSGEMLRETNEGFFMLSPEVSDEKCNDIMISLEASYSAGTRCYQSSSLQDIHLALEVLSLKGGSVLTQPRLLNEGCSLNNSNEVFCSLPEDYSIQDFRDAIRSIKLGKVPYECFSGFSNVMSTNFTLEGIHKRNMINYTISLLAFKELSEKYPYLSPLIYDLQVGSHYEILVPLATYTQKLEFKDLLRKFIKLFPIDSWVLIPYINKKDLIVKRFAYEKVSSQVFVPLLNSSLTETHFILVFEPSLYYREEDMEDQKEELVQIIRKRPALPSPLKEERCFANCGLERSMCCVDTLLKQRIEPFDLSEHRDILLLTPVEEEKLIKMEYGLRGYFGLGGILKGLYDDPPLPPIIQEENQYIGEEKRVFNTNKEGEFLLHLITTQNAKIPVLTLNEKEVLEMDLKSQLQLLWNEGKLLTPWAYAMLENHLTTVNLFSLETGGKKLLRIK